MHNQAKAFIFDLNGTMIDDMAYHVTAWHQLINEDLGANLTREEVSRQMYGKNSEVLTRIFGPGQITENEIDRLSVEKEKRYQKAFRPKLALIKGLRGFIEQSYSHHISMAIGSAAIPFNIDFVLDNLNIRHYFTAIVSADDVAISKPHPETYLKAASLLQVSPADCIVFEDAPKGVEAALHAGIQCVVITTMHTREEFLTYPNILHFISDYTDLWLRQFF